VWSDRRTAAPGWVSVFLDAEDDADVPDIAVFCPACIEREFEGRIPDAYTWPQAKPPSGWFRNRATLEGDRFYGSPRAGRRGARAVATGAAATRHDTKPLGRRRLPRLRHSMLTNPTAHLVQGLTFGWRALRLRR
jgi:hypothetical protein